MAPAMEECYSPHPKKLAELWNAMQAAAAWPAGMGLAYRPMLPFPSFTPSLHPALKCPARQQLRPDPEV